MSILANLELVNVDYGPVETELCYQLSRKLFDTQVKVFNRVLRIPDNSEFDYAMWTPPDRSEDIESFENLSIGRILDDIISDWGVVDTFSLLLENGEYLLLENGEDLLTEDGDLETNTDEEIYALHGSGLIFNTDDEAKVILVKSLITDKKPYNLKPNIKLDLMALYYYLYIGDSNNSYHYINSLSTSVKDAPKHQDRVRSKRRWDYAQVKAFEL